MTVPAVALAASASPDLQHYVRLLPLDVAALDTEIEREVAENPWLEFVERPYAGFCPDEVSTLATETPSLTEHLAGQLAAQSNPLGVDNAAMFVVGALDEDGYLREETETLAKIAGVDLDLMALAIAAVQRCEPAGIAARSLGERFRLQLAADGATETLAYNLTANLETLAAVGREAFAAQHGLAAADVAAAIDRLRVCDPHPSAPFACDIARIVPEIVVDASDGVFRAQLDTRLWPTLRLTSFPALRNLSAPMRDARRRARAVVDALARRRSTLEKLAHVLVEHQHAFFAASGDRTALRPLTGRELAQLIGCAESTVSRAITSRYASTPFGTVALRSLLVRSPGSVAMTTRAVRETIRQIVADAPQLSDAAVERVLRMRGIRLARRTVTKYRGLIGLPTRAERIAR